MRGAKRGSLFPRGARNGERSTMKQKVGFVKPEVEFGKCPRCGNYDILAKFSGIKALCCGCLSTVERFFQGDQIGGELHDSEKIG